MVEAFTNPGGQNGYFGKTEAISVITEYFNFHPDFISACINDGGITVRLRERESELEESIRKVASPYPVRFPNLDSI